MLEPRIKFVRLDDDGFELNITVASDNLGLPEDHVSLNEIVKAAISKGFSRFVGVIEPDEEKLEWLFIFSLENDFNHDDMLVHNPIVKARINTLIVEELANLRK